MPDLQKSQKMPDLVTK